MTKELEYKGYKANVDFEEDADKYSGKVEGIRWIKEFEASTIESLEKAFKAIVDDNLNICKINDRHSKKDSDEIKVKNFIGKPDEKKEEKPAVGPEEDGQLAAFEKLFSIDDNLFKKKESEEDNASIMPDKAEANEFKDENRKESEEIFERLEKSKDKPSEISKQKKDRVTIMEKHKPNSDFNKIIRKYSKQEDEKSIIKRRRVIMEKIKDRRQANVCAISKEVFVETINNIIKQSEKMDRFSRALEEVADGYVVFDSNNLYLESLLQVLNIALDDKDDYISWWLYEDVEKVVWCGDKAIDLSTPEKLYDFLTENKKADNTSDEKDIELKDSDDMF